MAKSFFVVIEGGECTGKSTQMKLLVQAMKVAGINAIETHEPGGTEAGEAIRSVLIGNDSPDMSPRTELFLFLAARSAWMEDVVLPAIQAGISVVGDRSYPSTFVYQSYAGGMPLEMVEQTNVFAMGDTIPDLVIILDISRKTMVERMLARNEGIDRIEAKGEVFHAKVLAGYRQFVEDNAKDNVVLVEGEGSVEEVHQAIVAKVNELLKLESEVVPVSR